MSNRETRTAHRANCHCHCGFEHRLKQLRTRTGKRLGMVGTALVVAHLLFHVVECIVVPAVLVGVSRQVVTEQALATDGQTMPAQPTWQPRLQLGTRELLTANFADLSQQLNLHYSPALGQFEL